MVRLVDLPRSTYYYQYSSKHQEIAIRREKQLEVDYRLIRSVLNSNPYYGHRRISYHCKVFFKLNINHKRVQKIKYIYNLQTRYRRKSSTPRDVKLADAASLGITNRVKGLLPSYPNHIWSSDFTYLNFKGEWYYLSTMKDNYTKEILAWSISANHNTDLISSTLNKAITTFGTPLFHHSDQGSEYRAASYRFILSNSGIVISMSAKGRPTENGYQEGYYSYFKLELGNPNKYHNYQELVLAIGKQIYYYNYNRIHSVIKTTPNLYRKQYYNNPNNQHQNKQNEFDKSNSVN